MMTCVRIPFKQKLNEIEHIKEGMLKYLCCGGKVVSYYEDDGRILKVVQVAKIIEVDFEDNSAICEMEQETFNNIKDETWKLVFDMWEYHTDIICICLCRTSLRPYKNYCVPLKGDEIC